MLTTILQGISILKKPIDYILHFASPASPKDYLKIPIQTLKAGSLGTHNLLGLAKAKKSRILIASTSEVYGNPLMHPQKEEYNGNVNSMSERGVYEEAKRFQESMTIAYHRYHGLEVRIARIFNTFGPRMRLSDGRVIPSFINQLLSNKDLTIFGDGQQTRSFCYVDDLVESIYKLLFSDYNRPVNLGNTDEISILTLALEMKHLTNSRSKIIFKNLPIDEPTRRKPDLTLAKSILNWEPHISRIEGIKRTLSYYK